LLALPELAIHLADEDVCLSKPGLPAILDPDTYVWRGAEGEVCAFGFTRGEDHWMHFPGLARYRFDTRTPETVAVPESPLRVARVRETYWRCVLPMVLHVRGHEVLHASAVRGRHGVVGFCAPSGTGKSTLAYALSRRGYTPWTDDALVFAPAAGSIETFPLPFNIYLRSASAHHFGTEAVVAGLPVGTTDPPCDGASLISVCILSRASDGNEPVQIHRVSPLQALPHLLAHAYAFGVPSSERRRIMLQTYFHLAARVPVFDVRVAPGLEFLEAVLDGIERIVCAASLR
jgi:hypothetical protein